MGRFSCPYHLSDHCLGEKGTCAAGGALSDPEQQKEAGDPRGKSRSMLKKKVGRATFPKAKGRLSQENFCGEDSKETGPSDCQKSLHQILWGCP